MMKKFMISMDESVFERLDDFSKKKHVNRSAVMTLAVQHYLDAQDKLPDVYRQVDQLSEFMPIFKKLRGMLEDVEFKSDKD